MKIKSHTYRNRNRAVTLQDFEQVVLETALENVVSKYSRHLEIIKPALEMLLQQVSALVNQ